MKKLRKILAIDVLIIWIVLFLAKYLLTTIEGGSISDAEIILQPLLIAAIIGIAAYCGAFYLMKSKLNFLEKRSDEEPKFLENRYTSILLNNRCIDIDLFSKMLRGKYVISYKNSADQLLKFRTKVRLNSCGIGFFLKMEKEKGRIRLIAFSLTKTTTELEKATVALEELIEHHLTIQNMSTEQK